MAEHGLDAAGIGPQKTGTTWLDACLRAHPDLCLPQGVKETFFLDRRFGRGWGWHGAHFEGCGPDRLRAEVGPTWFDVPEAAARLADHDPGCRIVPTLRDPAERSWSLYLHHRRKGRVGEDFRAAVREIPRITGASRYGEHLPRWIDAFGGERVHPVLLQDVRADPHAVLAELWGFLGLDAPEEPPAAARRRVNPAAGARSPVLARWAVGASRWLRDRGLHGLVDGVRRAVGGIVYRRAEERPAMPAPLRAELVERFADDVRFVEGMTGRDLSAWRSPAVRREREGAGR